jgi:hypothetical protein
MDDYGLFRVYIGANLVASRAQRPIKLTSPLFIIGNYSKSGQSKSSHLFNGYRTRMLELYYLGDMR